MAARLIGAARGAAVALAAVVLAGCGLGASGGPAATFPPQSFGPAGPVSAAVAQTRGEVVRALGARSLQVGDPQRPFRPPESARLAVAPRRVIQVLLPGDADHGYISIYEFRDVETARAAGEEEAAYVSSGPGRVQFPSDTRFTIRQLATTLIVFTWSPANAADPKLTGEIQAGLETIGTPIPLPR